METRPIRALADLRDLAMAVLSSLQPQTDAYVIGLSGDLGAGKTAFVKEVAKVLGIGEEITSPTFVIMKSYNIPAHEYFKTLTHIDAYRIESDEEMRVLRFDEVLRDPARLICIEWPERIARLIPSDTFPIHFEITDTEMRTVTYGRR